MRPVATLCTIEEAGLEKIIALSPEGDLFFVNADDLMYPYDELAAKTEASGKVLVLGMLFGPEVEK